MATSPVTETFYHPHIQAILLGILVIATISQQAIAINPIRVNVGGAVLTDPLGQVWEADDNNNYCTTGNAFWACPKQISNTDNDFLYCTYRWFNQAGIPYRYNFPNVPNGQYTIRLHFAELYVPSNDMFAIPYI
jgi:hypothetical protein